MLKKLFILLTTCLLLCLSLGFIACNNEEEASTKYTITFYDENGVQLESKTWNEDALPSYNYSKTEDDEYVYTFIGWSLSIEGQVLSSTPPATANASYYAIVTKTSKITLLGTLKSDAIAELDEIVNSALSTIKSESQKTELKNYYNTQKTEIEKISDYNTAKNAITVIIDNTKDFISQFVPNQTNGLKERVKGYVNNLKSSLSEGPYSYIPVAMRAGYTKNLVELQDVTYDFSQFVNVNNIKYGGFGEQWNMVITNILESERFYKILNPTDSVFEIALSELNNFLNSEGEDVNYSINKEKFALALTFENEVLCINIQYKTGLTNSFFGNITPTITMKFDVNANKKDVFISLSSTNSLRYVVTENKYEFAINYGVSAGSRTAYCSFIKNSNNTVTGHIYEYISANGNDVINSCADFYITDTYVSVVGNKASGIIGFKGYINELYKASEGKLLGYEVRESLTFAGVTGTYNTLWFNLSDISGITSVKALEHKDGDAKNANDIFVNGNSDKIFTPAYNKKLLITTSRKFDIELRKQYFYYLDSENNICQKEVSIPMMFIQADNDSDTNFTDYSQDVKTTNGITSSVKTNSTVLTKIESDYATLIDVFITNKENMNSTRINEFIYA